MPRRPPGDHHTRALHVKPEAETTVPSNAAFSFLGSPGDPLWIPPQSSSPDLLYAGWAAHEVPSAACTA
ncbi:hypothetical protein ACWGN9_19710 [Streptomyces sp. NPDC055775]|uniref:hypothetical protein n=1 Tax=unclassified Streptomyces TaxID=2593676 RepID=UPI0033AC6E0C